MVKKARAKTSRGSQTSKGSRKNKKGSQMAKRGTRGYTRTAGLYGKFGGNGRGGGTEYKYFERTDMLDSVAPTTLLMEKAISTTIVRQCNSIILISNGNGPTEMIGRKITIKSIQIKGSVVLPVGSNGTLSSLAAHATWRLYIILDKQPNGVQASANDVLQAAATSDENASNSAAISGLPKLENNQRFTILAELAGTTKPNITVNTTGPTYITAGTDKL